MIIVNILPYYSNENEIFCITMMRFLRLNVLQKQKQYCQNAKSKLNQIIFLKSKYNFRDVKDVISVPLTVIAQNIDCCQNGFPNTPPVCHWPIKHIPAVNSCHWLSQSFCVRLDLNVFKFFNGISIQHSCLEKNLF